MRLIIFLLSLLFFNMLSAQQLTKRGIIAGNIIDAETGKAIIGGTISLFKKTASDSVKMQVTDKDGDFSFEDLSFGYYSIHIKMTGYGIQRVDSIYLRQERADFNLADIKMIKSASDLENVVIYAEKPLYENKDGKIIFNASESALSAGSSTTELLKQTPLVSVDNDGKILLKGKEVKILIDDKPVEMDARQLQDMLESMPGSMIEKIEVLTTPPPQYANERGGVINIVTKKGKAGISGRLGINYGTRGEAALNGFAGFRKNKWVVNFSAAYTYNRYKGSSYSNRENIYLDSTNHFKTESSSLSEAQRPSSRLTLDYERNKQNLFNLTLNYNSNNNDGESATQYSNINRYSELYKLSNRFVLSDVLNINPFANFSYTHKWKTPGEVLQIITGAAYNNSNNNRDFYQRYLFPDGSFSGSDSTQNQHTDASNQTYNMRINYDKPLKDKKTVLNFGTTASQSITHNQLQSSYLKKPENEMQVSDLLSNNYFFYQSIFTIRAAVRYTFHKNLFANIGLQQEYTNTSFDISKNDNHYNNRYYSTLPFLNITKKWDSGYSLMASYKRSIQRPGIHHLNPSIDYSDPYNTRFGNPYLQPYFSDNFDVALSYWNKKYSLTLTVGYNALQDIYSSIRTLQSNGRTHTTWQNLSGRKEYEVSFFGVVNIGKKIKMNISNSYSYNVYSEHDRKVNRYHDGGTMYFTFNGNYQHNSLMNFTWSQTYNKFATPQGKTRNNLSMNLGVQQKFLKKNLSISINVIDPFRQQQNKNYIQAPNYNLESFSSTNSRSVKIAAAYILKKKPKKKPKK